MTSCSLGILYHKKCNLSLGIAKVYTFAFLHSIDKFNPFLCIFLFSRCVFAAFENTNANYFIVVTFGFIALFHCLAPFQENG